jgi:hypothetical protein
LSSIDVLLDIKTTIRNITPIYEVTGFHKKHFIETLRSLQDNLGPLFSKYLEGEERFEFELTEENKKQKIIEVINSGNKALISSNSAKNILKDWGIDPRKLIVTGGPFFLEDYQKVNPNIPDHALKGIKKKCKGIMDSIKSENWEDKDLYFIYETENVADSYTYEKIDQISDLVGKEVKVIKIRSWDDF